MQCRLVAGRAGVAAAVGAQYCVAALHEALRDRAEFVCIPCLTMRRRRAVVRDAFAELAALGVPSRFLVRQQLVDNSREARLLAAPASCTSAALLRGAYLAGTGGGRGRYLVLTDAAGTYALASRRFSSTAC